MTRQSRDHLCSAPLGQKDKKEALFCVFWRLTAKCRYRQSKSQTRFLLLANKTERETRQLGQPQPQGAALQRREGRERGGEEGDIRGEVTVRGEEDERSREITGGRI